MVTPFFDLGPIFTAHKPFSGKGNGVSFLIHCYKEIKRSTKLMTYFLIHLFSGPLRFLIGGCDLYICRRSKQLTINNHQ